MSGLIFTLILTPALAASLGKVLENLLKFREISKDRGWQGYIEEEGKNVEVFVRREGKKICLILPDYSIPEETCKKAVKKLTDRLYATIPGQKNIVEEINILGLLHSYCHYCLEKSKGLPFKCSRCGGYFCKKHRLPEDHDCPAEKTVKDKVKNVVKEKKDNGNEKNKSKKIIIKQVPCG